MTFYRDAGSLIFGTRLKRLSDRFLLEVAKTYRSLNIPFEVSWFPLFYLLDKRSGLSVTEIARELKITHSAVSQLVCGIEKKGFISFASDDNDRRKRIIVFTRRGEALMEKLRPVWRALSETMQELLNRGEHSSSLLAALDELEGNLDSQSLQQQILDRLDGKNSER